MLFVLAVAGQDRSRLASQLSGVSLTKSGDELYDSPSKSLHSGRAPASGARTLDIEPVLPGRD